MKKNLLLIILFSMAGAIGGHAQSEDVQQHVDNLNRKLDRAVVSKDIAVLEKHYGDDFVFTHSDGHVDSKHSWMKSIQQAHYVSREHDSTKVEVHGEIAIATGKLIIERKVKHPEPPVFIIKYVRIFARRNDTWQLICHRSVLDMEL
jgi:ketosteroid isomerase-like protein